MSADKESEIQEEAKKKLQNKKKKKSYKMRKSCSTNETDFGVTCHLAEIYKILIKK